MLIRFLAGLSALLVPALLIIGAIVSWALIRRPVVRGAAVGLLMLVLCANAVVLIASTLGQGSTDKTFAQVCDRYSKSQVVATRQGVMALLADYDWTKYRQDPNAYFGAEFYSDYLFERFFLGGANPYAAFGRRTGTNFDVKELHGDKPRTDRRLQQWPDATVGYHWETNDLSASRDILGSTLVVTDLKSGERLASWPAFATRAKQVALFPSMAVAPTPALLGRSRRCPSVADMAAFIQSVAKP
jgi:hypothetical protein